ncbi:hypothetical protein DT019_09045 [Streptomyces sp. SDr-06]|uniref:hypothetical protein n=1 Tax=Streptomyces sp. SDr-06 TaxID=2267702 RepID=UPI000DE84C42|nr:hypothetical protein [Streptomyces sp. SDr-06]RCH68799.1 hypothetical protein DT019_09045 [Streptomyces sp. SDr-06]
MISPDKVPSYTGDIGAVEVEVGRLRKAAQTIREHGGDVNTHFRNLSTVYRAPEAEYLFQTTQGVHDTSADFASRLETVAGALETYASEIRPLVDKLERLRFEAAAFVASVQGQGDVDPKWHHDKAKMAAHNALMHEVAATVRAFQDAEVAAADRITAVVGGTQWHLANGSPKQSNPYGFSAGQLEREAKLPWGTPEHFSYLPFGLDWHFQQFGESLGENIKGVATGFVDMFRPGQQGQDTRKGLLMTIVGAEDYLRDPDGNRPMDPLGPEGRPYAKAFAKSLVGWDDWKTNPGKAAGTVVFNALTFASGPLGVASKVGTAGKVGEAASVAARTAGVLSKVGEVLDPVGATAKVVGTGARALPKVSELAKNIAAVTKVTSEASGVHSIIDLKGGSKLHIGDGSFTISKDGIPNTKPAPHELPADQRVPSTTPAYEPELAGVGARSPEASHSHGNHAGETPAPGNAGHETPGHAGSARDGASSPTHDHTARPTGSGQGHGTGGGNHGSGHGGITGGGESSAHGIDDPDPGVPPGRPLDEIPPGKYSTGEDVSGTAAHPVLPEQESALHEALSRAKMPPQDQERLIQSLRKDPYGSQVAEMISRGHLAELPKYDQVLNDCKQGPTKRDKGMVPASYMALTHATELQGRGVPNIVFDLKNEATGVDLDLATLHSDGTPDFAYQFKDVDTIEGINSAVKKATSQLKSSSASHRIAFLDVHQPLAEMNAKMFKIVEIEARKRGAVVHLRFKDGSMTVPPDAPVFP